MHRTFCRCADSAVLDHTDGLAGPTVIRQRVVMINDIMRKRAAGNVDEVRNAVENANALVAILLERFDDYINRNHANLLLLWYNNHTYRFFL